VSDALAIDELRRDLQSVEKIGGFLLVDAAVDDGIGDAAMES
jgi:hypothetical protein